MSIPITITLSVDAAAAVRAGSGQPGRVKLRLDDSDLAKLTTRQREALALHIERLPGWGRPLTTGARPIGAANLLTLAELLTQRADAMGANDDCTLMRVCAECGEPARPTCERHPWSTIDNVDPRGVFR